MSQSRPWVATVWLTQFCGASTTGWNGPHAMALRSSSWKSGQQWQPSWVWYVTAIPAALSAES